MAVCTSTSSRRDFNTKLRTLLMVFTSLDVAARGISGLGSLSVNVVIVGGREYSRRHLTNFNFYPVLTTWTNLRKQGTVSRAVVLTLSILQSME